MYQKRKDYLMGALQAEAAKLSNQSRFICEKCDGTLTVENKKRKEMIAELIRRKYDSDPDAAWRLANNKDEVLVRIIGIFFVVLSILNLGELNFLYLIMIVLEQMLKSIRKFCVPLPRFSYVFKFNWSEFYEDLWKWWHLRNVTIIVSTNIGG